MWSNKSVVLHHANNHVNLLCRLMLKPNGTSASTFNPSQWGLDACKSSLVSSLPRGREWEWESSNPTGCSIPCMRSYSTWGIVSNRFRLSLRRTKQRAMWRVRGMRKGEAKSLQQPGWVETEHPSMDGNTSPEEIEAYLTKNVNSEELNAFLQSAAPDNVKEVAPTMCVYLVLFVFQPNKSEIWKMLTVDRLHELSLENRADIIRGMYHRLNWASRRDRSFLHSTIASVLLGTFGRELTILKEMLEVGRISSVVETQSPSVNPGDLYRIFYHSGNPTEHVEVMQHIAREATNVEKQGLHLIKVISDIDDTFYAGLHDRRYPAHTPYPGVSLLYQLISRSLYHEHDASPITFITARPRGLLSVGKNMTVDQLYTLGIKKPAVISGSLKNLTSHSRMARQKLENFRRYLTLFPEYQFVFFGDSGQGDVQLAQEMLKKYPNKMKALLIHDLGMKDSAKADPTRSYETSAYEKRDGMLFYRSYIGAGKAAFDLGLLSKNQLIELIQACKKELSDMKFRDVSMQNMRMTELTQDSRL